MLRYTGRDPIFKQPKSLIKVPIKDCAIVGNSGLLLDHEYGRIIDEHDFVMRFNGAPTQGFEKYVGNKTTVRFINIRFKNITEFANEGSSILFEKEYILHLLKSRRKSQDKVVDEDDAEVPLIPQWLLDRSYTLSSSFQERFMAELCPIRHSLGFIGIILALQYCEHVNAFGFGQEESKGGQTNHYFSTPGYFFFHDIISAGKHEFNIELILIRTLHNANVIRLYPDPIALVSSEDYALVHKSDYVNAIFAKQGHWYDFLRMFLTYKNIINWKTNQTQHLPNGKLCPFGNK